MLLLYQLQQIFKLIFTKNFPVVATEDGSVHLKLYFLRQ